MNIAKMLGALALLASCSTAPPVLENRAPPPPVTAPQASAAPVAAPGVSVPADRPVQTQNGDIRVPGITPNVGAPTPVDPRNTTQRMADIRAWDHCVTGVQNQAEANPMRPNLTSPEEYCAQRLGMSSRTAVPHSR